MKLAKLLLILVFLTLTLGQFGRLPILSGLSSFYLQDLAVFLFVLGVFSHLALSQKLGRIAFDSVIVTVLVFIFWALISFIYHSQWQSLERNTLGFSYWVRFLLYSSFYLALVEVLRREGFPALRIWVIRLLFFSGLAISVAGFLQLVVLPDLSGLAVLGYDPHRNRLVSTFLDPNFAGAFIVLSLNLVFSVRIFSPKSSFFLSSILLLALLLTFSRSAWIMLAVSVLLFGLFKSKKLIFVAVTIGFLAYFLVPRVQTRLSGITDPDDSAKLRFVSWQRAVTIASENLFLGVGFNNFRSAQEEYGFFDFNLPEGGRAGSGADSSLLLILATTGLVGLFLYLIFYLNTLILSLRRALVGDTISLALFVSLVGLLVGSQFINSLFFTPILLWLFTVIAVSGSRKDTV